MAVASTIASSVASWIFASGLIVILIVVQCFRTWISLRHVPGPFWSRLTNIPRVRWILSNKAHDHHIAQHRRYGPIVRFGPNMVSVSDPAEIPNIYGFSGRFVKSDFYHVLLLTIKGKGIPGLFATQDENLHRVLKRPIANIYSMSNLVSFEPLVNSTIQFFFKQLDERFAFTGAECDFDQWLQMFAFDTMGEITFSNRFGFLETGTDVSNIMANIWKYFNKAAPVTQIPWFDYVWTKNPLVQRFQVVPPNPMVQFAMARVAERQAMTPEDYAEKEHLYSRDFLTRLREAESKASNLPPWAFIAWLMSNIAAGSDTTAILLRTIFHQLILNPDILTRLRDELAAADVQGGHCVPWASVAHASTQLPMLDAVIKESGRLHPPFGLPLERVVPPEGAMICGHLLPGGTVVGMSPWVVGRDEAVFGKDVDEWRPQRWLQADEAGRKRMENSILTFGAGHRVCIGKNISTLEVYKLVPSLVMTYDFEFTDPSRDSWKVANRWFVNQTGLRLRLKRRSP